LELLVVSIASPAKALSYTWNVNLSEGVYTAVGTVTTDTDAANAILSASDITSWSYTLTDTSNGTTDTLNSSNSTKGYLAKLQVDSTGNSLILLQNGAYSAVDSHSTADSSIFYFGYPYTYGSTPDLAITINDDSSGDLLYSTNVFATAATPVPFEIPFGATLPAFGSILALGVMRKARNFKKA